MAEIKELNGGGTVLRFISNKYPITSVAISPKMGGTIEKN